MRANGTQLQTGSATFGQLGLGTFGIVAVELIIWNLSVHAAAAAIAFCLVITFVLGALAAYWDDDE